MGLSTKQVSSHGIGWRRSLLEAQGLEVQKPPPIRRQAQQNQPQQPPEKCPRCDSMNTKFCYYNNYNKSQPRYFCKTCKRHWTKGGTLRNVPVGGGRKNKRLKTSNSATKAAATTATNTSTTRTTVLGNVNSRANMIIQPQQPQLPSTSEILLHSLNQQDLDKGLSTSSGIFLSSTSPLAQNHHPFFSFSSSSGSFEGNPSSISTTIQSSNPNFFAEEAKIMEDLAVTTFMPTTVPSIMSSNGMDMTSCWNLEDIDKYVPWDVSEIKP